jgi:hypothetical protein
MIRKPTWITLAVFLILMGFVLLWPQLRPEEEAPEITPTPESPWTIVFSDITGVKVENFEKEMTVELHKDAEGQWISIVPVQGQVDIALVEQRFNWLASPVVDRELSGEDELTPFGLDEPKGIITVTSTDGTIYILLVGDVTMTGSMRYVMLPSDSRVLLIDKYDVNSVLDMVDGDWILTPTPEDTELEGTETIVP